MQRSIVSDLDRWKSRTDRKPLIVRGVRQCGKTWLLKDWGRKNFSDVAYFNFESAVDLSECFAGDLKPQRILTELGVYNGRKLLPQTTLIILDEIQFCPRALTALKYFYEQTPDYAIACAGSLLGISLAQPQSFPVGKVEFLTLYPLSFEEFLSAQGQGPLLEYLEGQPLGSPLPELFAGQLEGLLKNYYLTGGMPEVVTRWVENHDLEEVERIQDQILGAYELDFAKHAPAADFPKLSLIWKSIPDQLARAPGKFFFGHAKPGARAKDLEDALQWLLSAGMAFRVCRIEKPGIPLSAYSESQFFKLYLSDCGLLRRLAKVPAAAILGEAPLYAEFKGALTENYVLNQLVTTFGEVPYYWQSGNTAEVDFLLALGNRIVPIEVKSSTNVRSRSLALYRERYQPELAVRLSMRNAKEQDGLLNLPLYWLGGLRKLGYRS